MNLMLKQLSLQERFDTKYEIVEPGGCWAWMGSIDAHGYGQISVGSRVDGSKTMMKAHRLAWLLHYGQIPKGRGYHGTCVLHRCDVRCCVNPDHLWLGTNRDNQTDMKAKGRSPRGEAHYNAKLTEDDVARIRAMEGTMLQREIAARFGVSVATIGGVLRGRCWAWVACYG